MDYLLSREELDTGVNNARKEVLTTSADHRSVAALGIAIQKRFLVSYSQKDLDDGLENLQAALVESRDDSYQVPAILNSCSIIIQTRAAIEEHLDDALVAASLAQTAVQLYAKDTVDSWHYKLQYCQTRTLAHELSPYQNQTDDVLAMLDQLLVDPPDRIAMHNCRSAKGHALHALYKWTGDDGVTDDCIKSFSGLDTCETEKAKIYVAQSYGESYYAVFDRGGRDLMLAIAQGFWRLALESFHKVYLPGTHPYEPLLHRLCGTAASRMFQITHGLPHIEAAKESFFSALRLMGPAHILRSKILIDYVSTTQLSAASQQQTKTKVARDLVAARRMLKLELNRSGLSSSQRRKFSYLLQENYKASNTYGFQVQEANYASSGDHGELQLEFLTDPDMLVMNNNRLVDTIWGWRSFSDESYDTYKSLALRYEAVVMGPMPKNKAINQSNKLRRAGLKTAAALLLVLFFSRHDKEIGSKAASVCIKILVNPCFDSARRLWAGTMAGICLYRCLDEIDETTKSCIDLACMLLPNAILIGIRRKEQLFLIRKLHYTPKLAASIYIAANEEMATTISVLEKGRSIIWDQLIARHIPLEELQKQDADLANRWRDLRQHAAAAETFMIPRSILQDPLILQDRERTLYRDMKQRCSPHSLSHDFDELELKALAAYGPIAILNVTELRSDAIVICADGPHSLHLPKAGQERCKQEYNNLKQVLEILKRNDIPQDQWEASDKSLHEILLWLWTAIVDPILRFLTIPIHQRSEGPKPRIWWVTSSWANVFPLHAAGDHKKATTTQERCSLLDLTESSYIPTLRALREARRRMDELTSKETADLGTALLVAMRETADRRSLPKTMTEIETVHSAISSHFETTSLHEPYTAGVISLLGTIKIAHIACHGETDRLDPMKSSLLFKDYGQNPLNVQTLIDTRFQRCQLVYLSACETTVNQDAKLLDEGIHISGGFQMAGVPNVVSTCWTVFDDYCVEIAKIFYQGLHGVDGKIDVWRCAKSLNAATLQLRDVGKSPLIWAAYTHFGV